MIFQWFKPHRSHYFSPRFVGPKKGHWDFLTFRNILWRDVTRGCSHLALGWYSQAGVGSAKVTKEESLFFFNTIIESTLEYEIFEMTLWFQYVYSFDLLAFWKDVWDFWVWLSDGRTKSSSNIWKARVFFWNPFSSNTSHWARPEALREFRSFQKTCAGAVRFRERWLGKKQILMDRR